MRRIKLHGINKARTAWSAAAILVEAYLATPEKASSLLNQLPDTLPAATRSTCQALFLGALRHGHRTRHALRPFLRKQPRPAAEAPLLLAGYELFFASADRHPQIIHNAVEESKARLARAESGLVNAVLRKLPRALSGLDPERDLAAFYSHPAWLVEHWMDVFGPGATRELLEWNQRIPQTYTRHYGPPPDGGESVGGQHGAGAASAWAGFARGIPTPSSAPEPDAETAHAAGTTYVKDPSTRLAGELLRPRPGERVLDLCAAPGGKSFDLAHHLEGRGALVAVDKPGPRIRRLRENLGRLPFSGLQPAIVEEDVLRLGPETLTARGLPDTFDAVLLDAPCSNTGVIQRRPDVKWRLTPADIPRCAALQKELLAAAAPFVRPGGRIVYSTCSIEAGENEQVIRAFLESAPGADFFLAESRQSRPWESGHDGAGVFRLERNEAPG